MLQLSEETKKTGSKLLSLFRGKEETEENTTYDKNSSSADILSGIYKLMVKGEQQRKTDYSADKKEKKAEERELDRRHKELLKALTIKRKPEKETKQKKEKQEAKKNPPKPPTKKKAEPTPEKGVPKEVPSKKPEVGPTPAPKPAPAPAPKPTPAPAPKAPEPAPAPKPTPAPAPKAPEPAPAPKPAPAPAPKPTPSPAPKAPEPAPAPVPPPKSAPAPAPKPAAEPVKKPTVSKPSAETVPKPIPSTTGKGLVIAALAAAGLSKTAQANILANVQEESNFIPQSENLEKYSAENLFGLYGPKGAEYTVRYGKNQGKKMIANPEGRNKTRFQTLDDADKVVAKGPVAIGDVIYGGRMGNSQEGDGYKYRGRGFIQITGKEAYEKIGKMIGEDLIKDPDLANRPDIAAKIVPAFLLKYKGKKPKDLEDIQTVISAIGPASSKSIEERKKLAAEYSNSDLSPSPVLNDSKLNVVSTENRDMKKDLQEQSKPTSQTTNNVTVNNQSQTPKQTAKVDDRSAFEKASKG